jgi:tetratricopeptide (TPR) repeat protein
MSRLPDSVDTENIEKLYDRSRYLDAFSLLEGFDPPESWTDTRARLIAGRLLANLGAHKRSARLQKETWRRNPGHEEARCFYLDSYYGRHGPFETLRVFHQLFAIDAPPANAIVVTLDTARTWLICARCLSQFRDFEAAELWLAAAEQAYPDDPWIQVDKAIVRQISDRYEDAQTAVEHALEIRADYRPAIELLASLLSLRGNDDSAIEILRTSLKDRGFQSVSVAVQLTNLWMEQGRLNEALETLDLLKRFSVVAEKPLTEWLRTRRADILHLLGRDAEAVEQAQTVRTRFYEVLAERLNAVASGRASPKRILLDVGFVRQHHMTCAPATIAAVSAYWGRPIDHLALARVITYDGTPDHEERHWLQSNGWRVREFRVTWESAVILLERGMPFTLVTTSKGAAHLQAVVGCDCGVGTFVTHVVARASSVGGMGAGQPPCRRGCNAGRSEVAARFPVRLEYVDRMARLDR